MTLWVAVPHPPGHRREGRRRHVPVERRDQGRGLGAERRHHHRQRSLQDLGDRVQGPRHPRAEHRTTGAARPSLQQIILVLHRRREHRVLEVPDRRTSTRSPCPIADVTVVRGDPKLSKEAQLLPEADHLLDDLQHQEGAVGQRRRAHGVLPSRSTATSWSTTSSTTSGKAILSFIPKGMTGYDTSDNAQSFDPTAAKALLPEGRRHRRPARTSSSC